MKSGQDDRALRDVGIATRLMKEDEKLHTRYARAHDKGVAAMFTLVPGPMSLDDAIADSESLLAGAAEEIMRTLMVGSKLRP